MTAFVAALAVLFSAGVAPLTDSVADVGFYRVELPGSLVMPGVSFEPSGRVRNFGPDSTAAACSCHVRDAATGQAVYAGAALARVAGLDSLAVSFSPGWIPPDGDRLYRVDMETFLAGDMNQRNDSAFSWCTVFRLPESLTVPPSRSLVTLDGVIDPAEWWDAASFDISNVLGLGDAGRAFEPGSVRLSLKHDSGYLYLACDAPAVCANDTTLLTLAFDDDNDRVWNPDTSEGSYLARHALGARPVDSISFRSALPDSHSVLRRATGSRIKVSFAAGHLQQELRIPLGPLPCSLDVTAAGDTCGFSACLARRGTLPGCWPADSQAWSEPARFGRLVFNSDVPPHPDVGISRICAPYGVRDTNEPVQPCVIFRNPGPSATAFDARFRIFDAASEEVYASVAHLMIPARDSLAWRFAEWPLPHPADEYMTRCSLWCAGDSDAGDNLRTGAFSIMGGYSDTGWKLLASVPAGERTRGVKYGAGIAAFQRGDTAGVYALKGNRTSEFYEYSTVTDRWTETAPFPGVVKKGCCLAAAGEDCYAVRGGNSLDFWEFTTRFASGPAAPAYPAWIQLKSVPSGRRPVRDGAGLVPVRCRDTTWLYLLKGSSTCEFYRFSTATQSWSSCAAAPLGASGKTFKNGSSLASDGATKVWALKGRQNELFAYDIAGDSWTPRSSLPLADRWGRRVKARDGCSVAWLQTADTVPGYLYALKGSNTPEFWRYSAGLDTWVQLNDIPLGAGKMVRYGGRLTPARDRLFALKGNSTLEFLAYRPGLETLNAARFGSLGGEGQGMTGAPQFSIRVQPNPFVGMPAIDFSLPVAARLSLRLYDAVGRVVARLADGSYAPGPHSIRLSDSGPGAVRLARGVYLLRVETDNSVTTRKLIAE
jgi:hypothetical protein